MTHSLSTVPEVHAKLPRVLTILIHVDTKIVTDSLSTLPEVHAILTKSTHSTDNTKTMTHSLSAVPEVHALLAKSTHNTDRYKDYDTQFISCT